MDTPEGHTTPLSSDTSGNGTPQPQPGNSTPSSGGQPPMAAQRSAVGSADRFAYSPQVDQTQPSLPTTFDAAHDYNFGAIPPYAEGLPDDITWTAAEFVEHQKSTSWYVLLVVAALVVAVADFFFTHDFISTGVILLAAALFGVYAGHKPRTQQYRLSPQGLQVGEKLYGFQAFRNFSVTEEAGLASIVFMPLKRFAPALTIYVATDLEDRVLDYLSEFLPFEQHQADAVDALLRRIRF